MVKVTSSMIGVYMGRHRRVGKLWGICMLFIVFGRVAQAFDPVGCYGSLDSSFSLQNTSMYQSGGNCEEHCRSISRYMAMQSNDCYCGNLETSLTNMETSNGCNVPCPGYGSEQCGGSSAFNVYRINFVGNMDSSSGASASSTASSTASSAFTSGANSRTSSNGASATSTGPSSASSAESSSSPASGTSAPVAASTSNQDPATVVLVSSSITTIMSFGVETVITSIVTQTPTAEDAKSSSETSGKPKHKALNTSTLVGGLVGGILGLLLLVLILLLMLRRIAARREQERMEKEYQEAIKPVNYEDTYYMAGDLVDKPLQDPKAAQVNPFDDSRRISNGSLKSHAPVVTRNVLTVVNPDQ
ncbi:Slg1p Ecym_8353 [Eremothecium cymbalariae DBVPG|uniref:WSC domain-containing protein n=1 Tax=Eremothecium cymbalariae (strain CBS 270.75 / DBVPG 7215 / KCTC 17166 / NRRL Y-17582) TaxID=931890 RepID=G8JXQ2_ERECY|nr:Hypothetical protein Ecym_8353 [Eremothecium cymbalariae DBVPG\